MILLILIGLIPFAALGVLLGHLLTVESVRLHSVGSRHCSALARRRLQGQSCKVAPCSTLLSSCCRPIGWSRPGMSLTPARLAAEGLDCHRRLDHRTLTALAARAYRRDTQRV